MIYLLHLYGVLKNLHLYKKILPQRFNGWKFPPCLYRNDKWYKHTNRIERSFSFPSLIDCPKKTQRETETGSRASKAALPRYVSQLLSWRKLFMWCMCICMCVDVCVLCKWVPMWGTCMCVWRSEDNPSGYPRVSFSKTIHILVLKKRWFSGLKHTEDPRLAAQQAPETWCPHLSRTCHCSSFLHTCSEDPIQVLKFARQALYRRSPLPSLSV